VELLLNNATVSAESSELDACFALWRRLADEPGAAGGERWGADWARLTMAVSDNTSLCLQAYMDRIAG
jgi:hypothetical protein